MITLRDDQEEFREIPGFPRYQVSNFGKVFSRIRKTRFLTPWLNNPGYHMVSLMPSDGPPVKILVHRLVAEAFIPNPDKLPTVNHKNGIKTDNNVTNLEWASYALNNNHSLETGLSHAFGETHYAAKLTNEDVEQIRKLVEQGMLHREVAAMFQVTRQNVTKIVNFQRRTRS